MQTVQDAMQVDLDDLEARGPVRESREVVVHGGREVGRVGRAHLLHLSDSSIGEDEIDAGAERLVGEFEEGDGGSPRCNVRGAEGDLATVAK